MARMTNLDLLNVPLENDYVHTLYFPDRTTQETYFNGCVVDSGADYTYQRKDSYIRYPLSYDQIVESGANYVRYQNWMDNRDGSGSIYKWYYAFITRVEYVNDEMSNIYIETDVMQTWLNEYTVKTSFVEREHTADDTKGANTVPEGIETGEYIVQHVNHHPAFKSTDVIVASTINPNSGKDVEGFIYNGVASGVGYYLVSWDKIGALKAAITDVWKDSTDCIQAIFACPPQSKFYPDVLPTASNEFPVLPSNDTVHSFDWNDSAYGTTSLPMKPLVIDGYKPRNNKLFTYPYTYMLMSNNAGGSAIYHYELFKDADNGCKFKIYCAPCPGFSIRLVPVDYKMSGENHEEGLNLGKLPICSWSTDAYTNWLTQNSVNVLSSAVNVGIGAYEGYKVGGATGAAVGGVASALGLIGEIYAHSKQPPQANGNLNGGDVTFGMGKTTFSAYCMTIRSEYAKIIDGFFDKYGYRCGRLKVPNTAHRPRYWYTKTIDVDIECVSKSGARLRGIPHDDIQKIKACYNNGITFWRHTTTIGEYPREDGTYSNSLD